ncbi:hypothetical protein Taro_030431 [Colocasia esculenta]|uniref:Uncharacterized protein n=1 Tax=Colocasia esculenta TaxID=4460 RepID=A0A843VXW4_COLES|nr:hypothetical protein [Colocasia esculenta]
MQNPEITMGAYGEGDRAVRPKGQVVTDPQGDRAVRPEGQVATDPRKGRDGSGTECDTGM